MLNKIIECLLPGLILLTVLATVSPHLYAADDDDDEDEEEAPKVMLTPEQKDKLVQQVLSAPKTRKGADTCMKCHDEDNEYPIMPIFKTRHATATDPRTPFAHANQCETCHGNGGKHQKRPRRGKPKAPIFNFGKDAWTPVKVQNDRCLACHSTHQRIEWKGSTHEFNDMACTFCHKIHVAKDPVLERETQDEVCFTCHANQRAKFMKPSHHPVREGQMSCSDCHNVHGEDGTGLMVSMSARERCTTCHAEKRGPFLWVHQPVAEDCGLCHIPHGSNNPALLKKRPPQLCQQCHDAAGHPSVSYNGSVIPSKFLLVKGCLNCHSKMHAFNHPSGVTTLR